MKRTTERIRELLPEEELLCQLAEECGELAQAALKLRRAMTGKNPTPMTKEEARQNLTEEVADVYCVAGLLLRTGGSMEVFRIIRQKKERWVARLEGGLQNGKDIQQDSEEFLGD